MLLNSDLIDVDKLDYLIRDAYTSGFNTVVIDHRRLLGSQSLYLDKKEQKYKLVYKKSAISVIENAVYAHDVERKWIQSHPVVQYESYLIKHGIELLHSAYPGQELFSYQFLTQEGMQLENGMIVRLLSDSDVVFLMKNLPYDKLIEEYFVRKNRMHPLWKSESEYKSIFNRGFGEKIYDQVESEFEELVKYLNFVSGSQAINRESKSKITLDIEKNEAILASAPSINKEEITVQINDKKKHLIWVNSLETFSKSQDIEFDFIIIKADQFNSSFGKSGFDNVLILFDNESAPCKFKSVTNVLTASKSERNRFYYLYYRRKQRNQKVNVSTLATALGQLAMQEAFAPDN